MNKADRDLTHTKAMLSFILAVTLQLKRNELHKTRKGKFIVGNVFPANQFSAVKPRKDRSLLNPPAQDAMANVKWFTPQTAFEVHTLGQYN